MIHDIKVFDKHGNLKEVINGKEYFDSFEDLKIVGTPSTGVNHIDRKYLEQRKFLLEVLKYFNEMKKQLVNYFVFLY